MDNKKTEYRKTYEEKMRYADAIIDGYNAIAGAIVAVLSYILGEHWILFVAFLLLNVADWITGWMKSQMAGKENSVKGWKDGICQYFSTI